MHFALKPARRKMRFLPLIAATYFMVSGGPYGIEDILGGAGFARAIVILLVLPVLWCLPTALMIGELAAALPAEGGFCMWVRRALGPFWGPGANRVPFAPHPQRRSKPSRLGINQ